jgi:hypothetical protein
MTAAELDRRLRAANPIRTVAPVDAPGLFASITSQVRDTRAPLRPARRRVLVAVVIVLAVLALLTTAVFAVPRLIEAVWVKPEVTRHEYKQAQSTLTLPPGYDWPKLHVAANTVTSPGAGGGDAVMAAMWAWEDYWLTAIKEGDAVAQERSHAELLRLLDHVVIAPDGVSENWTPPSPPAGPFVIFADDGGIELLRKAFTQAADGDPGLLRQRALANSWD